MREKSFDTVIIGGGFSSIPLVRELERDNLNFAIVNDGNSVWASLEKSNRLDFDLVSSLYTSTYSFELVEMARSGELGDRYPTSREFYGVIKKYAELYRHRTIAARVATIENFDDYSLLYLEDGQVVRAGNVVIATSFKRKIHQPLNEFQFDESLKGKTVLCTTTGDSANLLISKLVCLGAKVKLVSSGFLALDKLVVLRDGKPNKRIEYTIDQLEGHNISKISSWLYQRMLYGGYYDSHVYSTLARLLFNPSFSVCYPETVRRDLGKSLLKIPFTGRGRPPILNGNIAIKYWPIDSYYMKFHRDLEDRIREGFLLNDLPFFIDQGLVELLDADTTSIDKETKQFSCGGESGSYDFLIEGDREKPALPPIFVGGDKDDPFEYSYRDQYLGVIPQSLKNIFLLGFTRPFTGGLSNIIEMQCLLVHKVITDDAFRGNIVTTLPERIRDYNESHYFDETRTPSDHVVFYGFYTDEVAEVLDIQPRLSSCRTVYDVLKYFFFPNNAFYFRESGAYKVDGVASVVKKIMTDHYWFIPLALYPVKLLLLEFVALATILMLPLPIFLRLAIAALHFVLPITDFLSGKSALPSDTVFGYTHAVLVMIPLMLWPFVMINVQSIWVPALTWAYTHSMVHLGSRMGWTRQAFCDLGTKRDKKYREFFAEYKRVFRKVFLTD